MLKDPTRTFTLRDKTYKKGLSIIKIVYREAIRISKTGFLNELNIPITNVAGAFPDEQYKYLSLPDRQLVFLDFFEKSLDDLLVSTPNNNYLVQALTIAEGTSITRTIARLQPYFDSVLTALNITLSPEFIAVVEILHNRAFEGLINLSNTAKSRLAEILSRSVLQGLSINETVKLITAEIRIINNRARIIARTEIIRAYNQVGIEYGRELEDILGKKIVYIWQTAQDDRVRASHRLRDKKIYTRKRVSQLIGEYNCRCSTQAVTKRNARAIVKMLN